MPTGEEEAGEHLGEKLSIGSQHKWKASQAKPGIRTYKEERHSSPALETCRSWNERERCDFVEYNSCKIVVVVSRQRMARQE